jgi:1-acyl-sn-glycerol-3-phosphate acyltransferase
VVPVTIVGSHYVMPKKRFRIRPGTVTVIFHDPIEPKDFGSRECLTANVRQAIESGLPPEFRDSTPLTTMDTKVHEGSASS